MGILFSGMLRDPFNPASIPCFVYLDPVFVIARSTSTMLTASVIVILVVMAFRFINRGVSADVAHGRDYDNDLCVCAHLIATRKRKGWHTEFRHRPKIQTS